ERVDRLDGDVIGIPGADADNKTFSHNVSPVHDVRSLRHECLSPPSRAPRPALSPSVLCAIFISRIGERVPAVAQPLTPPPAQPLLTCGYSRKPVTESADRGWMPSAATRGPNARLCQFCCLSARS